MFSRTAKRQAQLAAQGLKADTYGLKLRAFFTPEQNKLKLQTYGCVRFIKNKYLSLRKYAWDTQKRTLSPVEFRWMMTHYYKPSEEYGFLKGVDKFALEAGIEQVDTAFDRFFKHQGGFPKFRSRKAAKQSYTTNFTNNNIAFLKEDDAYYIKLPKMGKVAVHVEKENARMSGLLSKNPDIRITSATISSRGGSDYISLQVEVVSPIATPLKEVEASRIIGNDLGIKTLCTLYDGKSFTTIANPRVTRILAKRIRKENKALSRKNKGSKNWTKAKSRLSKTHKYAADFRKDYNHKTSRIIADSCDVYAGEDLNIKGMVRNHKLSKEISSCAWNQLTMFIKYKLERRGGIYLEIGRFYPSSQTCNCCGYKEISVKDLTVREWTCPDCGTMHDRDDNASINIRKEGIRILETMGIQII